MSMCYNHLIVTTTTQCYVYNVQNWGTPQIFEIKDSVSLIVQSPKYFCLVDAANGIYVQSFQIAT